MPKANKLIMERRATTSGEYLPQINNAMVIAKMVNIK
jgi:hypothetical protein